MHTARDSASGRSAGHGRALVVYESMFGNTASVAEAIREGLEEGSWEVELAPADRAPTELHPFDLVVVGAPTHAFGMPSDSTRKAAGDQASRPITVPPSGVREWLLRLRPGSGARAATFDTRVRQRWVPGSAAARVGRRLHTLGIPVDATESFRVDGTEGPLMVGELARAREWARDLCKSSLRGTRADEPAGWTEP